jgi:hypothetical protein
MRDLGVDEAASMPATPVPRAHAGRSSLTGRPSPPSSLPRQLARGAIGFGLVGSAIALTPIAGPAALLLAPLGAVALGGCPTCWAVGLAETISAGRLERTCTDDGCELHASPTSARASRHHAPGVEHAGD